MSQVQTYRKPDANMIVVRTFFLNGMLSLQRHGIGRMRIAKSEMTLNIPVARSIASLLKQRPLVINLFQICSRGWHIAIWKIVTTR